MMTEEETWLHMADAFETRKCDKRLVVFGICHATYRLYQQKKISHKTADDIGYKAMDEAMRRGGCRLAPYQTPEGDAIRAKFCREQAAMLESEVTP